MSDIPEDAELVLSMPFVICKSAGGPFDDDAFVAGFTCGLIDSKLGVAAAIGASQAETTTVMRAMVPQLDLIAMRHGFKVIEVDDPEGEWAMLEFHREVGS